MLSAGACFAEQFEIVRAIGEGANGTVYEAKQLLLARSVALKILPRELLLDEKSLARFAAESQLLSRLEHPNIVKCYSAGQADNGQPYMVNELVVGQSLEQLLKDVGTLDVDSCRVIFEQVFAALSYAHKRGVVHRDLKPANIMISEGNKAKLIDFGLAKLFNESAQLSATPQSLTQSGAFVGTPAYMSPEQAIGGRVDLRSDIYSLGVILFESVSGKRPFVSESPMELMYMHLNHPAPDLVLPLNSGFNVESLEMSIRKCLQKNPEERFASIDELEKAFMNALGPALPADRRRSRITPLSILSIAFVFVAATLLGVIYLPSFFTHEKKKPEAVSNSKHLMTHKAIAGKVGDLYDLIMAAKRKRKVAYDADWKTAQKFCRESLQAYDHALSREPDQFYKYAIYLGKAKTIQTLAEHIDPSLSVSEREKECAELKNQQLNYLQKAMALLKDEWKYERVVLLRELAIRLYTDAYDAHRKDLYEEPRRLLEEAVSIKCKEPMPCIESEGRQNAVDDDISNSLCCMYMVLANIQSEQGNFAAARRCYEAMWKSAAELGPFGFVDHDQFLCLIEYPKFLCSTGEREEASRRFAKLESELAHVELSHGVAANYLDLCKAYVKFGLKTEAREAYKKTMSWLKAHQDQNMYSDLENTRKIGGF